MIYDHVTVLSYLLKEKLLVLILINSQNTLCRNSQLALSL